jgi:hypothetical protein
LLHGAKGAAPKQVEAPPASPPQSDAPHAEHLQVEVKAAAETPAKPEPKGTRKSAKKPDPKQVELEEAIADAKPKEMPAGGDVIPDMTGKSDAPTPTFNDCKAALVSVYDNYIARAKAAGETDENTIMAGKIAYAKKLVYGFGIQKLMDLKPEQYAEFITKAKPFIDGTAKVEAA